MAVVANFSSNLNPQECEILLLRHGINSVPDWICEHVVVYILCKVFVSRDPIDGWVRLINRFDKNRFKKYFFIGAAILSKRHKPNLLRQAEVREVGTGTLHSCSMCAVYSNSKLQFDLASHLRDLNHISLLKPIDWFAINHLSRHNGTLALVESSQPLIYQMALAKGLSILKELTYESFDISQKWDKSSPFLSLGCVMGCIARISQARSSLLLQSLCSNCNACAYSVELLQCIDHAQALIIVPLCCVVLS